MARTERSFLTKWPGIILLCMQIGHLMNISVWIVSYSIILCFSVLLESYRMRLPEERLLLSSIHCYRCDTKHSRQYLTEEEVMELLSSWLIVLFVSLITEIWRYIHWFGDGWSLIFSFDLMMCWRCTSCCCSCCCLLPVPPYGGFSINQIEIKASQKLNMIGFTPKTLRNSLSLCPLSARLRLLFSSHWV